MLLGRRFGGERTAFWGWDGSHWLAASAVSNSSRFRLMSSEKVCIIGAGSSGIAACQVLNASGIAFDCFEKGSQVGGNWRYENDNGMSSSYGSLHIDSSKELLGYSTFPMPESYPVYPDHRQIARYFDDYVERFGLKERITFRTEVLRVEPV